MALTKGAWTTQPSGNSRLFISTCNVAFTTAENDAYTLKTPMGLDPLKPWTLLVKFAATPDGSALPLEIYGGYTESFAVTGDGATIGATDGVKLKQVFDDVVLAVTPLTYQITFDPNLPVADVVTVAAIASGPKVRIPPMSHYAFNLNGASTLNATNADFTIIQYK